MRSGAVKAFSRSGAIARSWALGYSVRKYPFAPWFRNTQDGQPLPTSSDCSRLSITTQDGDPSAPAVFTHAGIFQVSPGGTLPGCTRKRLCVTSARVVPSTQDGLAVTSGTPG